MAFDSTKSHEIPLFPVRSREFPVEPVIRPSRRAAYLAVDCALHQAEADILTRPTRHNTVIEGYVSEETFTALPREGFDPESYAIRPAAPTRLLKEGDVIDLGDRHLEVLHLPGHSPGSIALWEAASATLFSGDIVFDGPLFDQLYHSKVEDYVESMERLRTIPVQTVHGGHYPSFGPVRFHELIEEYLAGKRQPGCPSSPPPP